MNFLRFLPACSLLFLTSLSSLPSENNPFSVEPKRLIIQNRILANVGDTTISVLDVVKKMEVFLNKYYPQYADSIPAKYRYFSSQWREMLSQMIDHELMLLDAEKMELKISDGEVREQLFEKFGPNVMATLDKVGISYEEARSMIHSELVVQKMSWFKVHAKALSSVNSQDVRSAYEEYCKNNPPKEEWEYQILSIKGKEENVTRELAEKAFALCKMSPETLSSIPSRLLPEKTEEEETLPSCRIAVSDSIKVEDRNLSDTYKKILSRLHPGACSEPVPQKTGNGEEISYRIFHLKDHRKTSLPTFRSLFETLQNRLVQEEAEKNFKMYLSKLRSRYGFDIRSLEETIPEGFQPFSLQ